MSSCVWESAVLEIDEEALWASVQGFDFAKLLHSSVERVEGTGPACVGATRTIHYRDGAQWAIRILEISARARRVTWEVVSVDPSASFLSRVDTIELRALDDGSCFVLWKSDFSGDAGPSVTLDCKHKKLDAFADMRTAFPPAGAAAGDPGADSGAGREKTRATKESGARITETALIGGEFRATRDAEFLQYRIEFLKDLFAKQEAERAAKPRVAISITLPDGSVREGTAFETTPLDIAKGVSTSLAKKVVVAKVLYGDGYEGLAFVDPDEEEGPDEGVDTGALTGRPGLERSAAEERGVLWDVSRPLEHDCEVKLLTFDDPEGRTVFWHSSAHVLGEAFERAFGVNLCIGPPLDSGFYYDAYMGDVAFSDDMQKAVEEEAQKVIKEKQAFERVELTKEQALELFKNNPFKVQLISRKIPDGGMTTAYRCGSLVDLCTGPHLPTTGSIKAFALHKWSTAYWLGNAENDSLKRIYGVAFPDTKRLKAWQKAQKVAEERDHRRIGEEQELFFFSTLSPGSAFWLPAGAHIYNTLVTHIRSEYRARGYTEVVTPNIYKMDLWEQSGHAQHYRDDMFLFNVEKAEFGLKPMNCPGHCVMFAKRRRSHRELPVRFADFGVLHRNEASGALTGLTRVRRFQQDDAHIFCLRDQIKDEVFGVLDFIRTTYGRLGMTYKMKLSTRPKKALGDIALWREAEVKMADALDEFCGVGQWSVNRGDGAFYGPKIDIDVFDALGRSHQCATVQLDFQLPIRFDLEVLTEDGTKQHPVMIHRAILGSVERMTAILIEHFGGKWPLWLSPRQAAIIPVHNEFNAYADEVAKILFDAGFLAVAETSSKTLKKKVREAQLAQYNYICVVGAAEVEERSVSVRLRVDNGKPNAAPEQLGSIKLDDFIVLLRDRVGKFD